MLSVEQLGSTFCECVSKFTSRGQRSEHSVTASVRCYDLLVMLSLVSESVFDWVHPCLVDIPGPFLQSTPAGSSWSRVSSAPDSEHLSWTSCETVHVAEAPKLAPKLRGSWTGEGLDRTGQTGCTPNHHPNTPCNHQTHSMQPPNNTQAYAGPTRK